LPKPRGNKKKGKSATRIIYICIYNECDLLLVVTGSWYNWSWLIEIARWRKLDVAELT